MWIGNGHKMRKKSVQLSWDLDQLCICMCFIEFQKIFKKFQKLAYFWPKNSDFFLFSLCDFDTAFSTESLTKTFKNASIGLIFGMKAPYILLKTFTADYIYRLKLYSFACADPIYRLEDVNYLPIICTCFLSMIGSNERIGLHLTLTLRLGH